MARMVRARGVSCLSFSLLLALVIIAMKPRLASGATTVPGFIPSAAGAAVLAPSIPGVNSIGAIADSLTLGPSIASGIGGLAASTAVTSLAVITAFEQKMTTLKALTAEVLSAKNSIVSAVKLDASNQALNLVFTPLNVIEQKATSIQGILKAGLTNVAAVLAGVVQLAGGAATGVHALLTTVAGLASALTGAPATIATGLITGGLNAVAALETLTGLLSPLVAGHKALQLALAGFHFKLAGLSAFFNVLSRLSSGWKGLETTLVNACIAVARALGGVAGAEVQTLVNTLGPLGLPLQLVTAAKGAFNSLGLFGNLVKAVTAG